jgi:hypothetical protein
MAAKTVVADFTKTKDGGGQFSKKRMPTGDYLAKVVKVEDAEAKKDKAFQYLFTIVLVKTPSASYPYYCKIEENQLWKLRNLLIAAGIPVPKKRLKVDPNRAVGRVIGVSLEEDEYNGREQSTIERIFPAADLTDATDDDDDEDQTDGDEGDDEGEDEEPAEVEEPDEPETDPVDEMDRSELKRAIKELDEAATFKKSEEDDDLRTRLRELQAAATPNLDDLDEADDEDEEEEAPAPPPKKTAKKMAAKKKPAAAADDDIEDLDLDDLD